jgi:hypothetical protein
MVGAELLRQFRPVGATVNRRDLEPHVPGILHTQMTQAANTKHGDEIAGLRWRVSQGTELARESTRTIFEKPPRRRRGSQVRTRLSAGGSRIRTLGPPENSIPYPLTTRSEIVHQAKSG